MSGIQAHGVDGFSEVQDEKQAELNSVDPVVHSDRCQSEIGSTESHTYAPYSPCKARMDLENAIT